MTRARWLLSAASLFALWLLGALVWLPHLSRDLKAATQDVLSQQPTLHNRLGGLNLEFDGQRARLSGRVRTQEDRRMAENAVREEVRLPTPVFAGLGRHLNPVSDVQNEIEVIPSPPGWMLLAADGAHARLMGTAANSYEARDLARSVQEAWSLRGGMSEGMPEIDAENHDEAASVSATLRTVPAPQSSAQACLVRIGQAWKELTLTQSDAELQTEAYAMGVSEDEWRKQVRPALGELRTTLQQQRQAQEEGERLARLPPGYLFIAVRDQEVILRGEVGTSDMKRGILDDALAAFAPRRLHDEVRVSAQSRPEGDFGPITTALLPPEGKNGGKSCFLSFSGGAWKPVDWQVTPREQSWRNDLPSGLDARLLQNDSAMLSSWLHGDDAHSPAPSQRSDPAFITLALFGTKAILSGQVAEEAVRTQLIAAVRQAYSPPFFVSSGDVQVRGDCEPSSRILNTLKSLPPPPASDSAGMFAVAKPGGTWTLIPVTRELVEAGGLARSSLLPAGIPAGVVEELSAEAIEQLRLHLAHPAFP